MQNKTQEEKRRILKERLTQIQQKENKTLESPNSKEKEDLIEKIKDNNFSISFFFFSKQQLDFFIFIIII